MALTSAERARRARSHKAGDHSLCDPKRCTIQDAPETRGERMFREVKPGLRPAQVVLLEEAARITDRLDRLDAILCGSRQEWLRFRTDEVSGDVTVIVNSVLAESRQQAMALKAIVGELRQSAGPIALPRTGEGDSVGITDLTARIARRRSSKD